MVDSGSAPRVAVMHRHFPGAKLRASAAQKAGTCMATATGGLFQNLGEFDLPFHTQEGHAYNTTIQHANVTVPILSTGRMADHHHKSTFEDTGGTIEDKLTGNVSQFIRCHGVYFIKLVVDEQILNTGSPFTRQGAKA